MESKHWCVDNRLESVGKREKEVGHLNHNYKCVICDTPYQWGQINSFACKNCETIFVPFVDQTLYDEAYKDKYVIYQASGINRPLQSLRWSTVLRHKKTGTLLDFGCGSGAFLEAAPEGWNVYGAEINEHCVKHCKKLGLDTVDLHEIFNRKWDVVTLFDVLEHVPSLSVLNDINDSLNDDGLLVIATPNLTPEIAKAYKTWKHYRPEGEHTFYFSYKSIATLANLYGFEIIEANDNESEIRPPEGNIATYVLKKL